MRVALELQPCCGKRSGIGNYTYELARHLESSADLEFSGNIFNFLGRNDNSSALNGVGLPINECRFFPYGVYRRIWNFIPIPYQGLFREKADLSVFFNYIVPPRIGGKVITTVFDMTYLRFPETMEKRNLQRLRRGMMYSVERSDRIVTISEFSRSEITELLGVPEERVDVVPCAPSLVEAEANFAVLAKKYDIQRPYILYVGTIEPRKNLTRLARAFSKLKAEGIPHKLVLAGGRGWASDEAWMELQETKDVILTGYISDEEKNALYKNADVFVFPSLYEGFGIPPLEAMAFGCPVVASNAASLPEVVGDAAELVDPTDELSIAGGIWNVITNRAYSWELVQRGREQIKKYTWAASAKRLTKVCAMALGEK